MRLLVVNLFVVVLFAAGAVNSAQAQTESRPAAWTVNEAAITDSPRPGLFRTDLIQYDYDSTMTLTSEYFREEGNFYVTHYCRQASRINRATQCTDLTDKPYLVWGTWLIEGQRIDGELSVSSGAIHFYLDETGNNRPKPLQSMLIGSTTTVDAARSKATVGPSARFPQSIGSYVAEYSEFELTTFGAQYWRMSANFPTILGFEGVTWRAIPTDQPGTYGTTGSGTAYFLAR